MVKSGTHHETSKTGKMSKTVMMSKTIQMSKACKTNKNKTWGNLFELDDP